MVGKETCCGLLTAANWSFEIYRVALFIILIICDIKDSRIDNSSMNNCSNCLRIYIYLYRTNWHKLRKYLQSMV
jgi:hypothetical protein